ncbi:Ni/Fe-hydrogenase, b-type cytochrome subunit [Desulfosporosinus sp. FKA]|uniref:Ni/Fe-hydrogenase, b-type cytochrome subunit n=1 Tax=Desulfosporosinus sp. FKA TaxID=1969834 RepID=UPI000B4A0CA1|nr:Ni/Fe-hydrogenase, b-type cytochrome subunit [Desulfosporosinus sp. FKA]
MTQKEQVYVWQIPIRLFHWVNAFCITILFITGMYIGHPAFTVSGEAAGHFLMGTCHYVHVVTALIFTANMLFRLYWFWAGNDYAKLRFWRKSFWQDTFKTLKYYLFLSKKSTPHVGHNSLASLLYLCFIWLAGSMMIITGMAMKSGSDPNGTWFALFGWIIPVLGGEYNVRIWHHLLAWGYPLFLIGHLYMLFRQDILDKDGTVSSIITGYKFVETNSCASPDLDHSSETISAGALGAVSSQNNSL